jgi:hypothetical protein
MMQNQTSAPDIHPTYQKISSIFGPTYPPEFVTPEAFVLSYESGGISFLFQVPEELLGMYSGDRSNRAVLEVEEFPPAWGQIEVQSISIFPQRDPDNPNVVPYVQHTRVLEGVVGQGIRMYTIHTNQQNVEERLQIADLTFFSTPQEVLSQLGPPNRVNYKEDDKMRLHFGGSKDSKFHVSTGE